MAGGKRPLPQFCGRSAPAIRFPLRSGTALAASHAPHVVLTARGNTTPAVFQDGSWSRTLPEIAVFDDIFVAENVCSGVDVEPQQRQKLHDLILGARGVALSKIVQEKVVQIEEHNRTLRAKGEAIPVHARGSLAVDAFCALHSQADIEQAIQESERSLAAARAEDAIRSEKPFDPLSLPEFDVSAISAVLARDLPELEASAAARVQSQVKSLGSGGEAWIGDGVRRIAAASAGHKQEICPFCTQPLQDVAVDPRLPLLFQHRIWRFEAASCSLPGRDTNGTHG